MPTYTTPNFVLPVFIETEVSKPLASRNLGSRYRAVLDVKEIMLRVPK